MKQALNILLAYLTCTDPVIQNKWLNLLSSFWHKDDGWLIKSMTQENHGYNITIVNGEGLEYTNPIIIPQIPNSQPISYITGLQSALNAKVDKVAGKGLSTNDFTTALKNKIDALENYIHPDFHQISDIQNLQTILDDIATQFDTKVDKVAGKGLSTEDFTTFEQEQVSLNSKNLQIEVLDADGDFTLTDVHFRVTFFINTTGTVNITIPTATLQPSFVCFFIVVGAGQLNILVDGGGATLNAPDGTLLSNGNRGMIEKKITADTFYASGEWEV